MERKGRCSMAECVKVRCGQAGRLGMILLLFQKVLSDCGLKMKFLMPSFLPVCLLDQALLWD